MNNHNYYFNYRNGFDDAAAAASNNNNNIINYDDNDGGGDRREGEPQDDAMMSLMASNNNLDAGRGGHTAVGANAGNGNILMNLNNGAMNAMGAADDNCGTAFEWEESSVSHRIRPAVMMMIV